MQEAFQRTFSALLGFDNKDIGEENVGCWDMTLLDRALNRSWFSLQYIYEEKHYVF